MLMPKAAAIRPNEWATIHVGMGSFDIGELNRVVLDYGYIELQPAKRWARRTPLGKDIQLADLISPPAISTEVLPTASIYGWSAGASSITILHPASASDPAAKPTADDPLAQLVLKLSQHFEFIRAARFAHE